MVHTRRLLKLLMHAQILMISKIIMMSMAGGGGEAADDDDDDHGKAMNDCLGTIGTIAFID